MAKNNNNNKKKQSFFDQQVQQNGPGWIYLMTTDQIRKNALKVLKDLAFGNVDPYEISTYFVVPDFVYNLKSAADDNARYNLYSYMGLAQLLNTNMADPDMAKVAREHYEAYMAFTTASIGLNNILNGLSMYGPDYVPSMIICLMNGIRQYRQYFNGYFITLPRGDDRRTRLPRREIGGNVDYDKGSNSESQGPFWGQSDQSYL